MAGKKTLAERAELRDKKRIKHRQHSLGAALPSPFLRKPPSATVLLHKASMIERRAGQNKRIGFFLHPDRARRTKLAAAWLRGFGMGLTGFRADAKKPKPARLLRKLVEVVGSPTGTVV